AAAVAVGGEHRADAAAAVGVGAGDDPLAADALEHRLAGPGREAVGCSSQPADRVARLPHLATVGERWPRRQPPKRTLRLGLHIGYWGLGMSAQGQLELVLAAERLGAHSVWDP